MNSTASTLARHISSSHSPPQRVHPSDSTSCTARTAPKAATTTKVLSRRQSLLMLTTTITALTSTAMKAKAEDIGLFGLRKKLKKVEEEAEEIVKEGVETAEKGLETAEMEIVGAEKELETVLAFGGLAQAGVVAGAEAVGVLIATSVVNGILGPD
ncbi:hypothetical protein IFM89_006449 [Coptis chinensis]|uniref:Uncharacterized protein n=1 Tax=Coptis chinensis TaxID=261450 RepID=A0A835IN34_9MAGN|nr:hypothetical protein IFM89_006449 [Coptis chinensis]